MNDYWTKYANVLDPSAKEYDNKKLEHSDGFSKLPDLYFFQNGWQNDPASDPIKRSALRDQQVRNVQPRVCL